MKTYQIRNMTYDELVRTISDTEEELMNMKFQHVTKQLSNPLQLRYTKRNLAKLKTILREYELGLTELASTENQEAT
jgi:large subunit ribosomal protein L29